MLHRGCYIGDLLTGQVQLIKVCPISEWCRYVCNRTMGRAGPCMPNFRYILLDKVQTKISPSTSVCPFKVQNKKDC